MNVSVEKGKIGFHADQNMFLCDFPLPPLVEASPSDLRRRAKPALGSNSRRNFNFLAKATAGLESEQIPLVDMKSALNARILEIIN
jgi:hypothetical protein